MAKLSVMFDGRVTREWDTRAEEWIGQEPALGMTTADAWDFWLTVGLNLTDGRKSGYYNSIAWAILEEPAREPQDYRWLGLGFI
jgi:hypothetical protein